MFYYLLIVKQVRQRYVARIFGQVDVVLQEDGYIDCRDECNQAFRVTYRAVSYSFDILVVGVGNDDCVDEFRSYQQLVGINVYYYQRGDDYK